tara:strand:+ start:2195 stop:2467 length:273 start_codon:yes stop_codon:yes gene_type:complete
VNEAEALAAMKSGEGTATESHRYLAEISMVKMLRRRVRCFADGARSLEHAGFACWDRVAVRRIFVELPVMKSCLVMGTQRKQMLPSKFHD